MGRLILLYFSIIHIVFVFCCCTSNVTLRIGGLINENDPLVTTFGLRNQMAMEIAIEYLNSLPPISLGSSTDDTVVTFELSVKSTQTNAQRAVSESLSLFNDEMVIGVAGPMYSSESVAVSQQVGSVYRKPFVSYGATSDALSNTAAHPYLLRVVPPNHAQAETLVDFIYLMEWPNITIIHSNEAYGNDAAQQLNKLAELKQVKVASTESFSTHTELNEILTQVNDKGRKVFVSLIADFSDISKLIQLAYNKSMMASDYVWLFSETFQPGIIQEKEDVKFIDPNLVGKASGLVFSQMGTSFWVKQNFLLNEWNKRTGSFVMDQLSPFAFDSVLLFGLAARQMLMEHQDPSNGTLVRNTILKQDFLGASGRLKFAMIGEGFERVGTTFKIDNVIERNNIMSLNTIATWDYENSLEIIKDRDGKASVVLPGNVIVDMSTSQSSSLTITNSQQWRPLPKHNNPPSKRHSYTVAVSEKNDTLVIFGGADALQVFSDFYSFSFKENMWRQIVPISQQPPGRKDSAGFFLKDFFFVFGGFDDSWLYNDLWKFNFATSQWKEIIQKDDGSVPIARRSGKMVVYNGRAYLFGGQTVNGPSNDMWVFDPDTNAWTAEQFNANYSVPDGISDHCFVTKGDHFILFGGYTVEKPGGSNDLWFYHVPTKRWSKQAQINPPGIRYSAVCSVSGDYLYLGQGWVDDSSVSTNQWNDLYSLKLNFTNQVHQWVLELDDAQLVAMGSTGRDSASAVSYEQYFIWLFGWGLSDILNDFARYSTIDKSLKFVHNNIFSPSGIARHASVLIGNTAIVFGGVNSKLKPTSDLFSFNVDTETWSTIFPSGAIPRPRYSHATAVIEDQMFIFGGRTDDEYLSDLWIYSHTLGSWREIQLKGEFPSPRAMHTAAVTDNSQSILLYGGSNGNIMYDDLWSFNVAEEKWHRIHYNVSGTKPAPKGVSSTNFGDYILFSSGSDEAESPDHIVHLYDPNKQMFSEFASLGYSSQGSRATITSISDQYAFVFGGNRYSQLSNLLLKIAPDSSETMHLTSSFNEPGPRDQHSALFFGSKYLIFGGTGPITGTRYRNNHFVANDIWMLSIGPVCRDNYTDTTCYNCSIGTYEYRSQCLSCPVGSYSDVPGQSSCTPCPPGFFGLHEGATSLNFCYPCKSGTYNPDLGQRECKPCPKDSFCPLGSVNPLDRSYVQTALNNTIPVIKLPESTLSKRYKNISLFSYIGAGVASALCLLFWVFSRKYLKRVYTRMDIMFESNHNIHQGPMMRKRNSFGGISSLVAFMFIIALSVNLTVPFVDDNVVETRSLIPNLSVRSKNVTAGIKASVVLLDYAGACTAGNTTKCNPRIRASTSGTVDSEDYYTCEESEDKSLPIFTRNCTITLYCRNCRFSRSNSISLMFEARAPNTYTKGFYWSIESNSGYPKQNSSMSAILRAAEGTLFRGVLQETVVDVNTIQTVYTDGKTHTGFHLDYSSVTPGETTEWQSFSLKNGVIFRFDLTRSASSLEVIISSKKSWTEFVGSLLGSVAGIISLMGKIVQSIEKAYFKLSTYSKKLVFAVARDGDEDSTVVKLRRKSKRKRSASRELEDATQDDLTTDYSVMDDLTTV